MHDVICGSSSEDRAYPVRSPGVADQPVLPPGGLVHAVADDGDVVINFGVVGRIIVYSSSVVLVEITEV